MPDACAAKLVYVPENGIDPARFSARRTHAAKRPIKLVFVGRLVPYKGADMLLEAAAPLLRAGDCTLDVIGDGPERESLAELVGRLGLAGSVTLTGWVEHRELQHRLAQADVLAFPSIREFGGGVVLEAMAVGLVPLVVDYGGPGELVTPDSGIAVPIGTRAQIVARMRDCLERLATAPDLVAKLGRAAQSRAAGQFSWDAKARQMLEVYEWVLGRRPQKPNFGMPFPDPEPLANSGHPAESGLSDDLQDVVG